MPAELNRNDPSTAKFQNVLAPLGLGLIVNSPKPAGGAGAGDSDTVMILAAAACCMPDMGYQVMLAPDKNQVLAETLTMVPKALLVMVLLAVTVMVLLPAR